MDPESWGTRARFRLLAVGFTVEDGAGGCWVTSRFDFPRLSVAPDEGDRGGLCVEETIDDGD